MGLGGHNVPFVADDHGIRALTIDELLAIQGLSDGSFNFPDVPKAAKRCMIGNAVHPGVVETILNGLRYIQTKNKVRKYG